MVDYHLHSTVSHDGHDTPEAMARAAVRAGLREICFTDHLDYMRGVPLEAMAYRVETYNEAYDNLAVPGLKIRRGTEIALDLWSIPIAEHDLSLRPYDFVIGSLHYLRDQDLYVNDAFWAERPQPEIIREYFEHILKCIQAYDNFDVLGHLTYISKCPSNPDRRPILYKEWRELVDEILKALAQKGKGLEINTSGVDIIGATLPDGAYLRRFKELGGEIVTVGSDAHQTRRVGQYTDKACALAMEIFGHVCTFENRQPIFNRF